MRNVKSQPGSVRAERAEVTRQRIEEAARRLFAERGYGATTLREIADAAGVAVQTVYAVYGSKANILRALRERVRDDPDADSAYQDALATKDVERALRRFAHSIRLRWETSHDVVGIHIEAASVDADVRAELATVLEGRRRGIARLARSLVDASDAVEDVRTVTAVIDALTLPTLYTELTVVHEWSPEAYERWLATTLTDAVKRLGANHQSTPPID